MELYLHPPIRLHGVVLKAQTQFYLYLVFFTAYVCKIVRYSLISIYTSVQFSIYLSVSPILVLLLADHYRFFHSANAIYVHRCFWITVEWRYSSTNS